MTCRYCAEAMVIYDNLCRGCIVRRLARLPRPSIGVVIQHEGTTLVLGPEDARKLAKVCIRHFRPDLLPELPAAQRTKARG